MGPIRGGLIGASVVGLSATIIAFSMPGCGDESDGETVPEPRNPARLVVEQQLPHLERVMLDAARKSAFRQQLRTYLDDEPRDSGDGLKFADVIKTVYDGRDYDAQFTDHFTDRWGLTPRGEEALEVLESAAHHGIDPATLHVDDILDLQYELYESGEPEPVDGGFQPTASDVEALVAVVAATDGEYDDGDDAITEAVTVVDRRDDIPRTWHRFYDYNRREAEHFSDRARRIAAIEFRLVDGLLRYAHRLDRVHPRGADSEFDVDHRVERRLLDILDADDMGAVLRALEPSHPQYQKLLDATDRYRRFVAAGGWEEVTPFRVVRGAHSPHAEALRERLEAEGFEARPTSDDNATGDAFDPRIVDHTLIAGIRDYQRTHQFYVDGVPTDGFWRSLNISAEDRLAQMELTLQRWRQSDYDGDDDFIMVNIPEFYAEVWTDGQRRMRFPVVVGQNRRVCDPDQRRWVYTDKTPTVTSELDHIVLNPYWYVPPRIVRQTLLPRLEENEDYFDEEGYEEITYDDGGRGLRQRPGEDNAMGQVKFIFPNRHNVFMHDTPDKRYFDYGLRAYSHGCVRVSKPLELAEFLLEWEGRDDIDIDEVLGLEEEDDDEKDREPLYVRFDQELPVYLEYFTVWVDADGDPHFLIDLYDKDARRLSDDPERFFDCTPLPEPRRLPDSSEDDFVDSSVGTTEIDASDAE